MYIREDIRNLKVSVIRQMNELISKYDNQINLTLGEPYNDTPYEIKEYMAKLLLDNIKLSYPTTGGLIELRKTVAEFYNNQFGSKYNYKNVVINAGASEGISSVLGTILNLGDEVIIPIPAYPGYAPNIFLNGGKPIFFDTEEDNFRLNVEKLKKLINDKTRAIILTYPNNPTGLMLSEKEILEIVELIKENDIYLISDEIYATLTFKPFISFSRFTEIYDKLIIVTGMSKSHSMTGMRIGMTLGSEELVSNTMKRTQYAVTSANILGQLASIKALKEFPTRREISLEIEAKVKFLIRELEKLNFECIYPEGAYYIFVNIKNVTNKNCYDFCVDLIEKVQVGFTPGIAFKKEGYVRISVIKDIDTLKEMIERLKKYFKENNE